MPVIVLLCFLIGIPSIICYTVYRIRYKDPKVVYKEVYKDPPKPDREQTKIEYRIDMLDAFIRGSLCNVRDWRVVGDTDGMHNMFFTSNIKKCKRFTVIQRLIPLSV